MKRTLLTALLLSTLTAVAAAQENVLTTPNAATHIVPGNVLRIAQAEEPTPVVAESVLDASTTQHDLPSLSSVTPEMWLYLQNQQRQDDPKMAVRRKAEARAQARHNRITARKWFGLSNARPSASTVPFTDQYSPAWHGNGRHEFDWDGIAVPVVGSRDGYYRPLR